MNKITTIVVSLAFFALVVSRPANAQLTSTDISTGGELGTISGQVTSDGGAPAAGIRVIAYYAAVPFTAFDKSNPNTTITDKQGRYTLALSQWNRRFTNGPILPHVKGYAVALEDSGQGYVIPAPQVVDPTSTLNCTVQNVNFKLLLGPVVTVKIRDAIDGAPVEGAEISATNEFGSETKTATTGADGDAVLRLPMLKFNMSVTFPGDIESAPGYGAGSQTYRQFEAEPGNGVTWTIKTYRQYTSMLADGRKAYGFGPTSVNNWHGVVLLPDGKPAVGALVRIVRSMAESDVQTDDAGKFSISLPRIDYCESVGWQPNQLPEVFAEHGKFTVSTTLTPDETWDGMTFRLSEGPHCAIAGRSVDPDGKPLFDVPVTYLINQFTQVPFNGGRTGKDGRFTISNLVPGDGYLIVLGGGENSPAKHGHHRGPTFGSTFDPEQANFDVHMGYDTNRLRPEKNKTLNVGDLVVYPQTRVLSGVVVDRKGNQPTVPVTVILHGDHTWLPVELDSKDNFYNVPVPNEPLTADIYLRLSGKQLDHFQWGMNAPLRRTLINPDETSVRITML